MAKPKIDEKENKVISKKRQSGQKRGFTIVELLTVMSVIIILIGLLVPALNQVKRYAKEVKQRAQFHSIDVAMELFETEHDGYPPSSQNGNDDNAYCGAMKLAEAMAGQDLLGFHKNSLYRSDLKDSSGDFLYKIPGETNPPAISVDSRKGPYLQLDNANATRLVPYDDPDPGVEEEAGIYNNLTNFSGLLEKSFVLCDVYRRQMLTGYKTGMPILYYRAYTGRSRNPNKVNNYDNSADSGDENIYDYRDNDDLIAEGIPWNSDPAAQHPMDDDVPEGGENDGVGTTEMFYYQINNNAVPIQDGRPYRSDSYILLSAGFDGEYGTSDDIFNFQGK